MSVKRRPVNRRVAVSAGPGGVPAAVPAAGLMTHEHLAGAEVVAVRASRRRMGDPLPGRRLYEFAQHILKPTTEHPAAAAGLGPPNSNTGSSVFVCIGRHRMIIGYGHVIAVNLKPRNGSGQHNPPASLPSESPSLVLRCAADSLKERTMPSFREERLKEQVEEIRPGLQKAREIAELAESENRPMTEAEQKIYDEGVSKARAVADALKAHRHDQEVFAFARDLSDDVGIPGLRR